MKHFPGRLQSSPAGAENVVAASLTFSLDFSAGESRYRWAEPVDDMTTGEVVMSGGGQWRCWTSCSIGSGKSLALAGKEQLFEGLKQFVTPGSAQQSYLQAGEALGMSEGADKNGCPFGSADDTGN